MLSYEGIFFDKENIEIIHKEEKEQLEIINDEIHCTFRYHPDKDEIFNDIVGEYFDIYLIGYACDGNNSAFLVDFEDRLKKYYINYEDEKKDALRTPHITASSKKDATFKNAKKLDFIPLPKPIKITGRFGFWIKENGKEYVSFNKYKF